MNRFSLLLLIVLHGALGFSQTPGAKPSTTNVEPAIVGKVSWRGKAFQPREVLWPEGLRGSDVVLEKILVDHVVLDKSLLVDKVTSGIADCAVFLTGLELGTKRPEAVQAVIEKVELNFKVVVLRPGGRLRLKNNDKRNYVFTIANGSGPIRDIEIAPGSNLEFDLPPEGPITLTEKSLPFMKMVVFRPQWEPTLITGANGEFRVRGVPAGKLTLKVVHPTLGTAMKDITVKKIGETQIQLDQNDFKPGVMTTKIEGVTGKGKPVLAINDHVVGEETFTKVLQFVRYRYDDFTMPESALKRYVISGVLIPLVASLDHHQGRFMALKKQIDLIDKQVASGKPLAQAAAAAKALFLRDQGTWIARRDVEPWLGTWIFGAPRNLTVGPIYGARGVHYVHVLATEGRFGKEKRRFSQVFLPYEPKLAPQSMSARIKELTKRARVEAKIPDLSGLIPMVNAK